MLRETEPLDPKKHNRDSFTSGIEALDRYLKQQARKEIEQKLSCTFALTSHAETSKIIGFYTLSAGHIKIEDLPNEQRRKMPKYSEVGVTLLGRFAIDQEFQKTGLGEHLLIDAKLKAWNASQIVASFALIVDLLITESSNPTGFYLKYDFIKFPHTENKLYLPMTSIEKSLHAANLI